MAKKLFIDISTDEKKEEIRSLFSEFNKICEIYRFFGVDDTPYNNRYVHEIADEIGFDFALYKEKKKRYCSCCGKELKKGQKKFCSSSCAAKVNNVGRKHTKETKDKISRSMSKDGKGTEVGNEKCPICGKEIKNRQSKYCSSECFQKAIFEERVAKWKDNPALFSSEVIPSFVKRYFMAKYECKCQKCGWGEINESTGRVPLEIHHINGDCTDNREENLQLLCPNCHSLTPNSGAKNRNNSRRYKLKKYKELIKK